MDIHKFKVNIEHFFIIYHTSIMVLEMIQGLHKEKIIQPSKTTNNGICVYSSPESDKI